MKEKKPIWTDAWNDDLEQEYIMGDMNGIAYEQVEKEDEKKPIVIIEKKIKEEK